jgi:hypothetical protein
MIIGVAPFFHRRAPTANSRKTGLAFRGRQRKNAELVRSIHPLIVRAIARALMCQAGLDKLLRYVAETTTSVVRSTDRKRRELAHGLDTPALLRASHVHGNHCRSGKELRMDRAAIIRLLAVAFLGVAACSKDGGGDGSSGSGGSSGGSQGGTTGDPSGGSSGTATGGSSTGGNATGGSDSPTGGSGNATGGSDNATGGSAGRSTGGSSGSSTGGASGRGGGGRGGSTSGDPAGCTRNFEGDAMCGSRGLPPRYFICDHVPEECVHVTGSGQNTFVCCP